MRIAIVYSTKYGTTAKICNTLATQFGNRATVEVFDLHDGIQVNVAEYDTIILATSVYAGKPRKQMVEFCQRFNDMLLSKNLYLVVCGMDLQHIKQDTEASFSEQFRSHAVETTFIEGEFRLDKMHIMERLLLRLFFKVRESLERDYVQQTRELADRILSV